MRKNQTGSIIVNILIVTLFLSIVISALVVLANSSLSRAKGRVMLLQAQYAAESGADAAIAFLNSEVESTYPGTGGTETIVLNNDLYKSTYSTTVTDGSTIHEKIITSTGRLYQPANDPTPSYTRQIEVIISRSTDTIVPSGILSRNIIDIASGVKDIYAKDLYVNGYINTAKNTTNLISETITVAGKNTGAANCSIGGPGNLVKPASFTDPAQTRTEITVAYNNCITPPGNTSNSDFEVLANYSPINRIQSTFIPLSLYMDDTYLDAGSCSDWTAGSSPRTIPSAGNPKKTHYPDSDDGVSSSCGTSGSLALGTAQYNITDNVHIRANLCSASACNPVFHNPTSEPKYIFVEGSINFTGVASASGSGPIVLISYGADPASKASVCPLGGAVYLGQSGSNVVNAPQIYFLASNGICFDSTKFGGVPSFGGLSGKNIYFSTNPATVFPPTLNTNFPLSAVPVDLAWHVTTYRRL